MISAVSGWTRHAGLLCSLVLFLVQHTAAQGPPPDQGGDPANGEMLFRGSRPFQNGGPACGNCHRIAGLPFPNGGTMGPDLTGEYRKLGPEGMQVTLESLYFPAMQPLFHDRPLTPGEQRDLTAFIHRTDSLAEPSSDTPLFAGIAVAGCAVLLGITGVFWRNRLRKVRKPLAATGGNRT